MKTSHGKFLLQALNLELLFVYLIMSPKASADINIYCKSVRNNKNMVYSLLQSLVTFEQVRLPLLQFSLDNNIDRKIPTSPYPYPYP
jgi:hypothetical protein